jgi:hypothetical protein
MAEEEGAKEPEERAEEICEEGADRGGLHHFCGSKLERSTQADELARNLGLAPPDSDTMKTCMGRVLHTSRIGVVLYLYQSITGVLGTIHNTVYTTYLEFITGKHHLRLAIMNRSSDRKNFCTAIR